MVLGLRLRLDTRTRPAGVELSSSVLALILVYSFRTIIDFMEITVCQFHCNLDPTEPKARAKIDAHASRFFKDRLLTIKSNVDLDLRQSSV